MRPNNHTGTSQRSSSTGWAVTTGVISNKDRAMHAAVRLPLLLAIFVACSSRADQVSGLKVLLQQSKFDGQPGWFVIGEVSRSPRETAALVGSRLAAGIFATPLPSDHFQGLRPGLSIVLYG